MKAVTWRHGDKCNIVAGGSCLHSMNTHHYKAAFVNGIRSTRIVISKVNLHYTFCRRASSISCWYATSWHLFTYTWHKNAVRAPRITSTASPTGMINLIFFNLSSSVAFCHRDTSTSSPDSCFPCRASFNFVPSLQVAHWLSMHPSSNRQSAFSTLHCRLYVGSRALVRLMKFACVWHKHVSRAVLRLRSALTRRRLQNMLKPTLLPCSSQNLA